jgi:hypothetical protein
MPPAHLTSSLPGNACGSIWVDWSCKRGRVFGHDSFGWWMLHPLQRDRIPAAPDAPAEYNRNAFAGRLFGVGLAEHLSVCCGAAGPVPILVVRLIGIIEGKGVHQTVGAYRLSGQSATMQVRCFPLHRKHLFINVVHKCAMQVRCFLSMGSNVESREGPIRHLIHRPKGFANCQSESVSRRLIISVTLVLV